MSLAVTVGVCTVFSVTLNCMVPEESAASAGRVAFVPEEVILTMSAGAVVTLFQFASTAFTVTVNDDPADRALGLPVLPLPLLDVPGAPLVVHGAAVSPGTRSWSFVNAPAAAALTGTACIAQLWVEPRVQLIVTLAAPGLVLPAPLTVWVRFHRCVWLGSTTGVPPPAAMVSTTRSPVALVTVWVGVAVLPVVPTNAPSGVV